MSNAEETDDRTLIRLFVDHGKQSAFEQLVRKHSGKAFQIAMGVLANREDAEEVAQDAFVRIHRALADFRGDSEFSTWMYRIVLNLARNKYRWRKIRGYGQGISVDAPIESPRGDGTMSMELPGRDPAPDAELNTAELQQETLQALAQLPEVYRIPVLLRSQDDLSYEEIAEILHTKVGTIKSRISRGREELRRRLNL